MVSNEMFWALEYYDLSHNKCQEYYCSVVLWKPKQGKFLKHQITLICAHFWSVSIHNVAKTQLKGMSKYNEMEVVQCASVRYFKFWKDSSLTIMSMILSLYKHPERVLSNQNKAIGGTLGEIFSNIWG